MKNLHHWDVLVLSCIDGRFVKRIVDWAGHEAGQAFDYRTEVGCSKAIIDSEVDRSRLFNVLEVALRLHSIKELWLVDHIDCGAYGGSKQYTSEENEKNFHVEQLDQAAKIVSVKFPKLLVKKIYADWDRIEQL